MRWTRKGPGVYVCGEYRVERTWGEWYASGPGVDQCFRLKADAQAACAAAGKGVFW